MDSYKIYPKQFRGSKIPIEKNRCFVIMPFSSSYDSTYGYIKKALNDNGYICYRSDEIMGSKPIMNKVLMEILKAHFVIADLTDQNANVFYELGIAHTFKDAQNTILITQKIEDVPFDIRHINNIQYDPGNVKHLTSSIIMTLKENKHLMSFHEALQKRGIIKLIHDNIEGFVDYLQISLKGKVNLTTDILNGDLSGLNEKDITDYFKSLNTIITSVSMDYNPDFLRGIMKVMFESLISCTKFKIIDKLIYDFLYEDIFFSKNISEEDALGYRTDLSISLASSRVRTNIVMGWIIDYFSRTKTASIDLNRYKLERFLMTSDDPIIDSIICDSIFNKDPYIREHMADIIGEKKLKEAVPSLLNQFQIEENYFTSVSFISAIGKLEVIKGGEVILNWIEKRIDNIVKTNQLFVLKHSHIALDRIDNKHQTIFLTLFNKEYNHYIKDYFIL